MFLEISQNLQACNFIQKVILAQVFSCEFCEISKNTFFTEHPLTIASSVTMESYELVKRQPHKIVKQIQTIHRQIVDELFECLTIFWD